MQEPSKVYLERYQTHDVDKMDLNHAHPDPLRHIQLDVDRGEMPPCLRRGEGEKVQSLQLHFSV